jgi:FHA domain
MKAELVPDNGDPPIPIVRDVSVIGRREFCDIQIDHNSLSKRHAVLVKTDGLLIIRDLATTNGTKVKGQRIRWAALLPDDRITLGGYKMRVYLGPDNAPSPSEQPASVRASRRVASAIPQSPGGSGFPTPSPLGVPALGPQEELEIMDDDDDDDSDDDAGWRNLLSSRQQEPGDDVVIELD